MIRWLSPIILNICSGSSETSCLPGTWLNRFGVRSTSIRCLGLLWFTSKRKDLLLFLYLWFWWIPGDLLNTSGTMRNPTNLLDMVWSHSWNFYYLFIKQRLISTSVLGHWKRHVATINYYWRCCWPSQSWSLVVTRLVAIISSSHLHNTFLRVNFISFSR